MTGRHMRSAVSENSLVATAEAARHRVNHCLGDTRANLGQFLTPEPIAKLMTTWLGLDRRSVRLLDPGAGVGTLTAAVIERLLTQERAPAEIAVTCYEIDRRLFRQLEQTMV